VTCFGITGHEVLVSLSHVASVIIPDNEFARDVLILFGIGIGFKILFVIVAFAKCSFGNEIRDVEPPTPDGADQAGADLIASSLCDIVDGDISPAATLLGEGSPCRSRRSRVSSMSSTASA